MKVDELMIGDWVSYKDKMSCKITAICKDTAVVDNDTAQDWRIDYDKLTPVPLTHEILKKNGFTVFLDFKNFTYYESADKRIKVTDYNDMKNTFNEWNIHIDTEDMRTMFFCELTYVHEFQHALRFCGINKEIKI